MGIATWCVCRLKNTTCIRLLLCSLIPPPILFPDATNSDPQRFRILFYGIPRYVTVCIPCHGILGYCMLHYEIHACSVAIVSKAVLSQVMLLPSTLFVFNLYHLHDYIQGVLSARCGLFVILPLCMRVRSAQPVYPIFCNALFSFRCFVL